MRFQIRTEQGCRSVAQQRKAPRGSEQPAGLHLLEPDTQRGPDVRMGQGG